MTTINPHADLGCVMEYFSTDEIFNDKNIIFNYMNEQDLKESISYSDMHYRVRNFEYVKGLFAMVGKIDSKNVSQLVARMSGDIKKLLKRARQYAPLSISTHHNGPCLPGIKRLYVSVDGKYFPCEKVNEKQDFFCIGSVDDGFYINKSKDILNFGKLTEKNCKDCWALRLCSFCAGQIEFSGQPTYEDKLKRCQMAKGQVLFNLRELCTLNEFGIVDNGGGL